MDDQQELGPKRRTWFVNLPPEQTQFLDQYLETHNISWPFIVDTALRDYFARQDLDFPLKYGRRHPARRAS